MEDSKTSGAACAASMGEEFRVWMKPMGQVGPDAALVMLWRDEQGRRCRNVVTDLHRVEVAEMLGDAIGFYPERPSSDDHPGGPLSRAERVLLSHLKNRYFEARTALVDTRKLIGAIPGAQKIDGRLHGAITAVDRLLESIKTRRQGAPISAHAEDAAEPQSNQFPQSLLKE